MHEDLHAAWRDDLQAAGADPDAGETAFAELVAAYSAPGRFYHNLDHVRQVLATVERLRDEAPDLITVRLAVWFHDVVYDTRAADNEERSAERAIEALCGCGVPAARGSEAARLILLTQTHQPDPTNPRGRILTDADLAILGAEEAEYRAYARAIRREYAWVAEDAYRAGRAKVLRSFLARPRIYWTRAVFEALEARARRNLETELTELATMNPSTNYPPRIAELLAEDRLNPLDAGRPDEAGRASLRALTVEELFAPRKILDRDLAAACLAGLWLRHDCLDESHVLSQEIETPTGSYWHALMHRREGDFGNSKYWFRRVGVHPVFEALRAEAAALAAGAPPAAAFLARQTAWDPFAFVDLCAASLAADAPCHALCRRVQRAEWERLFVYCCRGAVGERG